MPKYAKILRFIQIIYILIFLFDFILYAGFGINGIFFLFAKDAAADPHIYYGIGYIFKTFWGTQEYSAAGYPYNTYDITWFLVINIILLLSWIIPLFKSNGYDKRKNNATT